MSVRWPDVDHPRSPQGYQWPPNLLIAQGPASWPRGRRPASEAEEILSEAVAWWDVERSGFRDGDRWLRNLGSAGGVLDLRLGSALVANSNDPKWLGPEASGYVYLPGLTGNTITVPSAGTSWPTSSWDVRIKVALDNWVPAGNNCILGKWEAGANQKTFGFHVVATTGVLAWFYSDDGTTTRLATSTVATGLAAGAVAWVRVTHDVAAGQVKFWLSDDDVTYTQLGSTVNVTTYSALFAGTAPFNSGTSDTGSSNANMVAGKVYRAKVMSVIDGTTVLDVDCDALTSGSATSFTAVTGQTVTINRATSGRKSVAMPARRNGGRACMALGTDDYLEVQDAQQHGLLNFYGSDSFTLLTAIRAWNTPTSFGRYIDKRGASGAGYSSSANGANLQLAQRLDDGVNNISNAATTLTAGTQSTMGMIVDRQANTLRPHLNGALGSTSPSTKTITQTTTRAVLTVGRQSSSTSYQDFEFRAAAIWRRPLTSREITVLANSNLWGT